MRDTYKQDYLAQAWSLTLILNHLPYYQNQPAGVYVFCDLGLYADKSATIPANQWVKAAEEKF